MKTNYLHPGRIFLTGAILSIGSYYLLIQHITHYEHSLSVIVNYLLYILDVSAKFLLQNEQLFLLLWTDAGLQAIRIDGLEFVYVAQASTLSLLATSSSAIKTRIKYIVTSLITVASIHCFILVLAAVDFAHHYFLLFPISSIVGDIFIAVYVNLLPVILVCIWLISNSQFFEQFLTDLIEAGNVEEEKKNFVSRKTQ